MELCTVCFGRTKLVQQWVPLLEMGIGVVVADERNIGVTFNLNLSIDYYGGNYSDSMLSRQCQILGNRVDSQLATRTLSSFNLVYDLSTQRTIASEDRYPMRHTLLVMGSDPVSILLSVQS